VSKARIGASVGGGKIGGHEETKSRVGLFEAFKFIPKSLIIVQAETITHESTMQLLQHIYVSGLLDHVSSRSSWTLLTCLQVILLMNVMNIINEPCNRFQFFNLPRAWLTIVDCLFFKKKKFPEDLGPIKLRNPCNNSKRQSKGKSMIFQMR
jgi:hypothetical protein